MSSSHAALVVDADPKGLESLVYGFQGADWRITACPTPETASLMVKASAAEIAVIASRTDHERAHTLIRQIRAKEAFRTLPLLVLGPEELRKPLKESGDADLLPLPAFVRDVLTASRLLVEAGAAATQKPGKEPSFAEPIAAATTLSLIRTLCGLARSGALQLERRGRHGEILFHKGEVTAAQSGQLQGMAAIQHILIWNDGALKLHLRPVTRRGQLHQTAQKFLDEFDRFQRDYAHAMKDIGPPASVYSKSEDRLSHSTGAVPAEVTPVVRLCDGQRTLSDIIDESPFRVLDTVRIVGRLVELAIFMRRDPKPPSDVKAPLTPLDEFLETARIVGPTTARSPRVHGENTDTAALVPGTPATRATQPVAAVVAPAVGAVPDAAAPTDSRPGAITAPLAGLPFTGTMQAIGSAGAERPHFSPVPKMATSGTQASGTIEPRERRTPSTMRTIPTRTSVVLDIAQIETATTTASAAVPRPAVKAPIVQSPLVQSPFVVEPTGNSAARIAGEIEATPSRKTVGRMPAQTRMSIQLDATLATESEKASGPVPVASVPRFEPNPVRVTGEMKTPPSGKATRDAGRLGRASSSFQIDPSLSAEAPVAEKEAKTRPSGSRAVASSSEKRHQSGSFSPIEKDFFEREADLYNVEGAESFADLEENRAKAAGKHGPGKKPGRPHRK
jgi:hypothetical protein